MRENDVLKEFGDKFGSVVSIELPTKQANDAAEVLREEREAKEREAEFKRAQLAVQ